MTDNTNGAYLKSMLDLAAHFAGFDFNDIRRHATQSVAEGTMNESEAFDVIVLTQVQKLFRADCPAKVTVELPMRPRLADKIATDSEVIPPNVAVALLSITRGDYASFESTSLPTHASVEVIAFNGGSAMIESLDLKELGPAGVMVALMKAVAAAHAAAPLPSADRPGEATAFFSSTKALMEAVAARHLQEAA